MSFSFKKKIFGFLTFCIIVAIGIGFFKSYVIEDVLFPLKYRDIIEKYSDEYDIPMSLVVAVINTESSFDKDALSSRGAKGLMQIMDITGEWGASELNIENFTPDMLFDPETNIHIGCWYLDTLNKQFDGETDTVLAAYNAGSGNVSDWLDSEDYSKDYRTLHYIPFEQTRNYVEKVNKHREIYKKLYDLKD